MVQRAARAYPTNQSCFSCHHQTLPLLAITTTAAAGLESDSSLRTEIIGFTRKSFEERRERLSQGLSIGGRAATVSYGLWTFALAKTPDDALTAVMVGYLLDQQTRDGAWVPPSKRPPLEESRVSCTVLVRQGLRRFASTEQHERIQDALARSTEWLRHAPLSDQEDWNFALWDAADSKNPERVDKLLATVLTARQVDGGWSQTADRCSDAYATGQTLYVLLETKQLRVDDPIVREAVAFLLETQHEDGSWHVATRSKPIQPWFDNGDPHGTDQFISIAATSWATAALAKAVAPPESP